MQSRLPQALADFSELLKMNPDFHQARVERAGIWAKQGRFEQARQELEICVEAAEGVQDDKVSQLASFYIFAFVGETYSDCFYTCS